MGYRGIFVPKKKETDEEIEIRKIKWNENRLYLDEWNRLYDCLKDKKLFSKLIGDNKFLPENLEKIVDPISKKLYIHYLTKTGLIRVFSDNSEQVREFVCQYICKEFPPLCKC